MSVELEKKKVIQRQKQATALQAQRALPVGGYVAMPRAQNYTELQEYGIETPPEHANVARSCRCFVGEAHHTGGRRRLVAQMS